jgi:glycosyltransferase involved in cell wall biosynthesis
MTTSMRHSGERAVPEHVVTPFLARGNRYALVIPVIDEGERIHRQLAELQRLGYPIDVVLADGGSTDGSTEPSILAELGVRTLLTKTGPGRLSAQLRMAYAYCLDEGYEGVVTVDGNGKDGLDAIPRFVSSLDDGFDYVQGSRYVRGGRAENTPADRLVAGRMIHAPLLSLAAGFRFTDTTNGFRAYSRRLLEDPRLDIFRAEFDRYALLFHVTARAHRLGFRCTEIGVLRSYPNAGPVPTKVRGLSSRFGLLAETVRAALGRYRSHLDL